MDVVYLQKRKHATRLYSTRSWERCQELVQTRFGQLELQHGPGHIQQCSFWRVRADMKLPRSFAVVHLFFHIGIFTILDVKLWKLFTKDLGRESCCDWL